MCTCIAFLLKRGAALGGKDAIAPCRTKAHAAGIQCMGMEMLRTVLSPRSGSDDDVVDFNDDGNGCPGMG